MMKNPSRGIPVVVAAVCLAAAGMAVAADSNQFRGPNRDGKFLDTGLLETWPTGGPPLAWTATGLGVGYSSVSVVGDTIYATGMLAGNQGYISLLDLDGNTVDQFVYGPETTDSQAPGPRSTPTIEGDRLYIMSGLGVVYCFDIPSRTKVWETNVVTRFGGVMVSWDYAESLLIDGDNVICTPGGPNASIVALNKMTGATIWQTTGFSDRSAYCSPNIVTHNGHRVLITMTAPNVVGLDPATGTVLWTHEFSTSSDVHAVSPVYGNGKVYYTGGYGSGGGALDLSTDGSDATPDWTDTTALDCHHGGVVLHDGYVYGTSDYFGSRLVCLDLATGSAAWSSTLARKGSTVFADGMLYVYEESGRVSLVRATPTGCEVTGTLSITAGSGNHWAHPTIANGRLYIRHGDTLTAFDVSSGGSFEWTATPSGGWYEVGDPLRLEVGVAGTVGTVDYQWIKDGVDLSGATTSVYEVASLAEADSGWYSCRVTDDSKEAFTTTPVHIEVFPALPVTDTAAVLLGVALVCVGFIVVGRLRRA